MLTVRYLWCGVLMWVLLPTDSYVSGWACCGQETWALRDWSRSFWIPSTPLRQCTELICMPRDEWSEIALFRDIATKCDRPRWVDVRKQRWPPMVQSLCARRILLQVLEKICTKNSWVMSSAGLDTSCQVTEQLAQTSIRNQTVTSIPSLQRQSQHSLVRRRARNELVLPSPVMWRWLGCSLAGKCIGRYRAAKSLAHPKFDAWWLTIHLNVRFNRQSVTSGSSAMLHTFRILNRKESTSPMQVLKLEVAIHAVHVARLDKNCVNGTCSIVPNHELAWGTKGPRQNWIKFVVQIASIKMERLIVRVPPKLSTSEKTWGAM
jgi:hypothetical protein